MISTQSRKDLDSSTAPSATPALGVPAHRLADDRRRLQKYAQRLSRLVRQRRTAATLFAATAVLSAVAGHKWHAGTAAVQPLAPAPASLRATIAAPALPTKPKHPLLSSLAAANPLHALATNPLRGLASWYGSVLHGHKTASGETFDEADLTACHRTLPFGTLVRVTDTASLRSVIVRINDRGVLNKDRVIDLSTGAAEKLGILRTGLARVKLEIVKPAKPAAAADMESN